MIARLDDAQSIAEILASGPTILPHTLQPNPNLGAVPTTATYKIP